MAVGSLEPAPWDVHTCPSGPAHGNSQLQLSNAVLEMRDEIKKEKDKVEGAGKRFQGERKKTTKKLVGGEVELYNSTSSEGESACRARCDAMEHASQKSRLAGADPKDDAEIDACENFCKGDCACMIPWEERCELNSCAGCPQCVVAPAFSAPADYQFDVVCPGQNPTAPMVAAGHLSAATDKLESGGCGNDAAKDLIIEYKNTCQGKGTLLVNSCYSTTAYDVVIALYTKQDGVKECNDDVGADNFCHTIEAGTNPDGSFLIPERYLVKNKYVACPADGASEADYGDGTGTIRCAAIGYDMAPNEVARVIVTSYSSAEGDFHLTNRLFDVS